MKKFLILFLFVFLFSGCYEDNSTYYIGFQTGYEEINILLGEKVDLTKGVIAYKDDTPVTNYEIDDSNVDYNALGSYKIYYTLKDQTVYRTLNITGYRKPTLKYIGTVSKVELTQYEGGYEALIVEGFTASDLDDGDLTNKIQFSSSDFDINVPGTYTVEIFVLDSHGNKSNVIKRTVVVNKKNDILEKYDIWTGGNFPSSGYYASNKCFNGDWSYTVKTHYDYNFGIEVTFTIPTVDINRYQTTYDESLDVDPNVKNYDNPSIYLGGTAWNESDVGITMSLVSFDGTTLSKGSYAWRPFWRYITYKDYDLGSYADHDNKYGVAQTGDYGNGVLNLWANWNDFDSKYYYLAGDKIRMICYFTRYDYAQLQIEVIEKSTLPESVEIRKKYNWDDPADFFSPEFSFPLKSYSDTSTTYTDYDKLVIFKRVNAIDQVNNEGSRSTETNTLVRETVYESAYLLREVNGKNYRVPMTSSNTISYGCPLIDGFITSAIDSKGGQKVTIKPEGVTNY